MANKSISQEQKGRFDSAGRSFQELYTPLMNDVRAALKRADEEPSAFNRRVAFRAVFAAIEGIIALLKDQLLVGTHPEDGTFSRAEIALLYEEAYQLDGHGAALTRQQFLRVADNLLFAWRMYFRDVLPEFNPEVGGDGWRCFRASLEVRNRITHPRSGADLEITDEDMRSLERAFNYVGHTTFGNLARSLLRLRRRHYERLDKALSHEVRSFLDGIYAKQIAAFESMKDSVTEVPLEVDDPNDLLSILESHGLAEVRDERQVLTSDCALYLKWRAEQH